MKQKTFYIVAGTIFTVVALLHFWRIINGWNVSIHTFDVPIWWSWIAVILGGYLAFQALGKKA